MAINIGDKVKFLNEEGGGEITQLIDRDTVMVLSNVDDFEIPVLIRELVVLDKEGAVAKSENVEFSANETKEKAIKTRKTSLIFTQKKQECECYLYNGTEMALLFGVFEERKEGQTGVLSGILQAQSLQKVATYSLKELEKVVQWRVQGFGFSKSPEEIASPTDCVIKIHPKKFFTDGSKEFIQELGADAVVMPLQKLEYKELKAEDFYQDGGQTAKNQKQKKPQRKNTRELLEVDLHIHELLESTQGMSNGDMLEYQLDTFRKVLKENQKFKGKKIVFIHGVGNGVLKQNIRHELQRYPRYVVQDASFQEYGFGATLVVIK